jgi:glycerol-3-phosphate dehydrogenase (NAD(P)+)
VFSPKRRADVKICVLGAGSFGTTMASLQSARNETLLWARNPDIAREITEERSNSAYLPGVRLPAALRATADLAEAVTSAELLIVAIPAHGFRASLSEAIPYIHPWIPVVSLTKGLEQGSHLRMTQIIEELLPGHTAAALGGPNIAGEIMAGQASASVIAVNDRSVGVELQQVLRRGIFRVYLNDDTAGCELGGALKNVIAIAAGMAQGIAAGDNTRAAVVTRGLAELTRLGVAMGGRPETFAGLTGLGDLMATCMSPRSRNRYVGEQLGLGRKVDEVLGEMTMVAEGVRTADAVSELAAQHGLAVPICAAVHGVLCGEITGADAFHGLQPEARHEADPD